MKLVARSFYKRALFGLDPVQAWELGLTLAHRAGLGLKRAFGFLENPS